MPMRWEEFQNFLMNLQPFRIRSIIYQLNQKGANLPMLGPQRDKVNRLMERFRRISTDQQREIFPEYFRDRMNANNLTNGDNTRNSVGSRHINTVAGLTNGDRSDRTNIGHINRPDNTRANPHRERNVVNPTTGVQFNQAANSLDNLRSRPVRLPSLTIHTRSQTTDIIFFNSQLQPRTPNLEERHRLPTFDLNSPLGLAPAPSGPAHHATYQLTPRPQRRASITGSPAPVSLDARAFRRRRSMSVSAGEKGACVDAASAVDGCGVMTNLECKICMDKTVECAIMPCGHACACYTCARYMYFSMAKCPICRGTIAEVLRIYW